MNTYEVCESYLEQEYFTQTDCKSIVTEAKRAYRTGLVMQNQQRQMLMDYEPVNRKMDFLNTDAFARSLESVEYAIQLDRESRVDAALDVICEHFDGLIYRGGFKRVSQLLDLVKVERLSIPLMLGFLTITAPLAEKIASRSNFFQRCKNELVKRCEWREELLKGLE